MLAFRPSARWLGMLAILLAGRCGVPARVLADKRDNPKPLPKVAVPAAISNMEGLPELPLALAGAFDGGREGLPPQDSGQPSSKPLWHYGGFLISVIRAISTIPRIICSGTAARRRAWMSGT